MYGVRLDNLQESYRQHLSNNIDRYQQISSKSNLLTFNGSKSKVEFNLSVILV